jgi:hypothetical protein
MMKLPIAEEQSGGILPGALKKLRDLLDNARRFFLCNTDRQYAKPVNGLYQLEELMWATGYAAAWDEFTYPDHMMRVQKNDALLMYANGQGIIGIGRAFRCRFRIRAAGT